MKKAIALLATLVVLTTSAFAQLTPLFSGYAETKWGANLDDETNGFELDSAVTVTVPLFAEKTVGTEDGEGATGDVDITGSSLTITMGLRELNDDNILENDINGDKSVLKGTDASISAKINFLNGAYATIGSESDIATNFVTSPRDIEDVAPTYGYGENYDENDGISLGYDANGITFEVTVANETKNGGYSQIGQGDATDATFLNDTNFDVIKKNTIENTPAGDETFLPNDKDGYMWGAKGSYTDTADKFNVEVAFGTNSGSADKNNNKKTSVAAKAEVTVGDGLTVAVPFDFLKNDELQAFELMPSVDYEANGITAGVSFHYISINDKSIYYSASDLSATSFAGTTLAVNGGYDIENVGKASLTLGSNLGEKATVYADVLGTKGFVGDAKDMDLTVALAFEADDYTVKIDLGDVLHKDGMDDLGIDATFSGGGGVAATFESTLSLDDKRGNAAPYTVDTLNVDLTSELHGVEYTTFTVNFSGFNLGAKEADEAKGTLYFGAKVEL